MRVALFALAVVLSGCSTERAPPKSLCDFPHGSSLAEWAGTTVHWKGTVHNAHPHGMSFLADECRGGLPIFRDTADGRLEKVTADNFLTPGILHAELTAKLVRGEGLGLSELNANASTPTEMIGLEVLDVQSLRFERMSPKAFEEYLAKREGRSP